MNTTRGHAVAMVIGQPRSGSTVLMHALGQRLGAVGLGEVERAPRWVAGGKGCSCGERMGSCPVWIGIGGPGGEVWPRRKGAGRRNFYGRLVKCLFLSREGFAKLVQREGNSQEARAARAQWMRIRSALNASGCRLAVDTSKLPDLLRFMWCVRPQSMQLKVIIVLRDPRGYLASKRRREGQMSTTKGLVEWLGYYLAAIPIGGWIGRKNVTVVWYEGLCAEPEYTIERIVDSLGLVRYTGSQYLDHSVGGSDSALDPKGRVHWDDRWKDALPWDSCVLGAVPLAIMRLVVAILRRSGWTVCGRLRLSA